MEKSPTDPSTYWTSKKSSPFRVKLQMSIKTIPLICIDDLTSFYMTQVSIKRDFRKDCILWSQEVLSFTYHTYHADNYMFTIRCGISWKLTRKPLERLVDVVQSLLTWNIFDVLFYCFCCWLWASKFRLPEQHSK